VLSLHIPWTPETNQMVDAAFVDVTKSFWVFNTSRGNNSYGRFSIGYEIGKGFGAGLDVLEYENYL
jgi:D-3-phosphoglycerate dehydrogenase